MDSKGLDFSLFFWHWSVLYVISRDLRSGVLIAAPPACLIDPFWDQWKTPFFHLATRWRLLGRSFLSVLLCLSVSIEVRGCHYVIPGSGVLVHAQCRWSDTPFAVSLSPLRMRGVFRETPLSLPFRTSPPNGLIVHHKSSRCFRCPFPFLDISFYVLYSIFFQWLYPLSLYH